MIRVYDIPSKNGMTTHTPRICRVNLVHDGPQKKLYVRRALDILFYLSETPSSSKRNKLLLMFVHDSTTDVLTYQTT